MQTRKRAKRQAAGEEPAPLEPCAVPLASRRRALEQLRGAAHVTEPGAVEMRLATHADTLHTYVDLVLLVLGAPSCRGDAETVRLMTMSPEEYATLAADDRETSSDEARRATLREGLDASTRAATGGGAIVCRKCSGDDVTIQQKQTRSADEGMTVFCTCETCGFKWRMS